MSNVGEGFRAASGGSGSAVGNPDRNRRTPEGQSLGVSPGFPDGGAATARPRSSWTDETGREHIAWAQNGMTIRDAMAIEVVGHYLGAKLLLAGNAPGAGVPAHVDFDGVAEVGYAVADAMLKRRRM